MGCGSSSNQVDAGNADAPNTEKNEPNISRRPSAQRSNHGEVHANGKENEEDEYSEPLKANWSEAELFHSKAFIYNNTLQNIRILIDGLYRSGEKMTNPDNIPKAETLLKEEELCHSRFSEQMMEDIKSVWNDPSIQRLYQKRSTLNLNDSAKYFLDNLDEINKESYTPTPKDLIMSYVPTVGVQNVVFTTNNRAFQLFDIGGQRVDRRKWATMYDGIDAIFFCLAISEYNQIMSEDRETNRLTDAFNLLEKISEEPKFKETPIFLFLNEVDVFREKLQLFPLSDYMNYKGNSDEEALQFMESLAKHATLGRRTDLIYIYRCCAIDTEQMSAILKEIFKLILKTNY